jgi:dolichol-phosphate mannosyltransferase
MNLSPEIVTGSIPLLELSASVVVPVFNQESKISYSLQRIKQAVESAFSNYELIVVNDGSTDNTLTIVKDIASTDQHVRVLSYTPNMGKGYAVRHGVLHSRGDAVIFLDGDLDISPDLIKDYVERLSTSDLVIASKWHPKSSITIPRSRAFLSRAFNLLMRMATGIPQKDTQVGLKVGKGDIMRTIFRNTTINRYAFDVELFAIASILHLKVNEMPIKMEIERKFNIKDIVSMFMDVMRICFRQKVLHAYEKRLAANLPVKLEHDGSRYSKLRY